MKLSKIFFPIIISIIYVIRSLTSQHISNTASILIGTVITFVTCYFIFNFFTNRMMLLQLRQNNEFEDKVLNKSLMNHKKGLFVNGGVGYLLADKFIFIPHKFNFSTKKIIIKYSNIVSLKKKGFTGIYFLKVYLNSGRIQTFIFNDEEFYENFQQIIEGKFTQSMEINEIKNMLGN